MVTDAVPLEVVGVNCVPIVLCFTCLERVAGIEPAYSAWKAD